MSIYTPDLTGILWEYYVSNYQRTIFKYPQKVLFEVPVFQNDRLVVTKLGISNSLLVYGTDYIVYEDDIDYDAMSVCKNIDSEFAGILLKSITILAYTGITLSIQVSFNQLFADSINYARINQAHEIEVTPILIANIVEQVTYLQQMVLNFGETYSEQSDTIKVALIEAPNGDNDENLITNEPHDIDTLNKKCLIRPIYGSFFKDSVVVRNNLSGVTFTPDEDYIIIDLDLSRTKTTANESGVYRIIKIIRDTVGEVSVDYRAYGGMADVASMRRIQDRINVIENFLSKTSYITPTTLPADPAIISIKNKLQEVEGNMRLLLQNGLPSYGDVSTGTAVVKKIVAQDSQLHWWTIGTLYRVDGSVDNILADVFKFRLKSVISNMMFECAAAVNVSGSSDERFSVACYNSNMPKDTLTKYSPKLRIIEVSAGGVYSGVILQLGMKLGNALQETFDIEDMSGRESCWKLVSFSASSVPPEDTGVLMPNGTLIYSTGETSAIVNEAAIPFVNGVNILINSANIPLQLGNINSGTIGTTENFDLVAQEVGNIPLSDIKAFDVTAIVNIGETDEREVRFVIPVVANSTVDKHWSGNFSADFGFAQYVGTLNLWYSSADGAYKVKFGVSASIQSITLNVTAINLMF